MAYQPCRGFSATNNNPGNRNAPDEASWLLVVASSGLITITNDTPSRVPPPFCLVCRRPAGRAAPPTQHQTLTRVCQAYLHTFLAKTINARWKFPHLRGRTHSTLFMYIQCFSAFSANSEQIPNIGLINVYRNDWVQAKKIFDLRWQD